MTTENLYFFLAGISLTSLLGLVAYIGYYITNAKRVALENTKKAMEKATEADKWKNAVFPRLENMF
jgi:hypothetical protein